MNAAAAFSIPIASFDKLKSTQHAKLNHHDQLAATHDESGGNETNPSAAEGLLHTDAKFLEYPAATSGEMKASERDLKNGTTTIALRHRYKRHSNGQYHSSMKSH